jgi:hypothetical protein
MPTDQAPSNSDVNAANPIQPTTSTLPDQIPASAPQNTPINNTAANKPDAVQQSQTASSAMANTATPPTPQQSADQAKKAEAVAAAKPSMPSTPQDLHGMLYKNVMGMLGGGQRPVMGPDGKPQVDANGTVVTRPGGVKTLGTSILAGAIAGMVAGFGAPDKRTELGGGRSIADNSGAAAAGAAAGSQYSAKNQVANAQTQADADQARAFAVTDHNLKQHAAILSNLKMQGDIMDETLDTASNVIQGMQNEQDSGEAVDKDGNPIDLIKKQNVSETDMQAMLKDNTLHVTRDMVFPDSKQLVMDSNGNQRYEYTYTIYDPKGMVRMTDQLRDDPAFKDKLEHVPNGQSVPVSILAKYATEQNILGSAVQGTNDQIKEYKDASGLENNYDLKAAIKDNQIIRQILPEIGKYAHYPLDIALDKMQADPSLKNKGAAFSAYYKSLGVTREGLESMVVKRAEDIKNAPKGQEAQPVPQELVAGARHDIAVRNPNLSAATVDSYVRELGPKPSYADYQRVMEKAGQTSDRVTNQTLARNKLSDQEQTQLFNNGRVGNTKLTLDNASDEMLVDQHTGEPIPWRALSKMAPTQQETNRADFGDTVLKTAHTLMAMKQAGQLPNGPLSGVTTQMLAAHGMSTEDAGKALAAISFMQTAATGAHVGGRFSVPVMEKMNKLISLNMNDSQFTGAMNEITDVMQHYVNKGGRISVAEWSDMSPEDRKRMMQSTSLAGSNAGSSNGGGTSPATTGVKVGDVIVQNGRNYTVTSVDKNGKVTGAK